MLTRLVITFSLIFVAESQASTVGDFGKEEVPLKVNHIWYSIPQEHFKYFNDDPNMTFADAMKLCERLDYKMEKEEGGKLALSSDARDHPHGVSFLLMLVPCNGYKVNYPPLLSQVLEACEKLGNCKPRMPQNPIKNSKRPRKLRRLGERVVVPLILGQHAPNSSRRPYFLASNIALRQTRNRCNMCNIKFDFALACDKIQNSINA